MDEPRKPDEVPAHGPGPGPVKRREKGWLSQTAATAVALSAVMVTAIIVVARAAAGRRRPDRTAAKIETDTDAGTGTDIGTGTDSGPPRPPRRPKSKSPT